MNISACKVWFDDEKIFVQLNDNQVIGASLELYPRLKKATPEQRSEFELWEQGRWIHWEALDEDLSAEGFLKYEKQHAIRSLN